MDEVITLAHGAGGGQTSDLIHSIFKKYLNNPYFTADDAAVLPIPGAQPDTAFESTGHIAMTTDGFIVSPAEFPGGDVGRLAVCGTVNDLSCMGARPRFLTCSFVIEEGFPVAKLDRIVKSMAETAKEAGVCFVAGDTKVAGKGQVDGLFITTAGIGAVMEGVHLSGKNARPGDAVIVTGDIGRHGCAILLARNEFGIEADVTSDDAPLWDAAESMLKTTKDIHVLRDATRGGVGTVLYEIAKESGVGVRIDREKIPVDPAVSGVCGMLGLEPLYLACEGRFVCFAPAEHAEKLVRVLREGKYSKGAAVIGEVTEEPVGRVTIRTEIGSETLLPPPGGELLPRIC
ncbi:MAG: hydrogenase expression/formation protein HypE [Bilifractor sp.]|jgi:hydrogenase expression/formation protein HypE